MSNNQNGNCGLHYKENQMITAREKVADFLLETQKQRDMEKEHVKKLVSDHWNYIKGVLEQTQSKTDYEIEEVGYHYRTAMEHGWRHAKEYFTGNI